MSEEEGPKRSGMRCNLLLGQFNITDKTGKSHVNWPLNGISSTNKKETIGSAAGVVWSH